MRTSNRIPNSVNAVLGATFASVTTLVGKTSAAAPISEDDRGGFLDDSSGATG